MRSTRKQPFCWQEKKINRLIRKRFPNKSIRSKMLLLYATLTEIDSDFNSKDIKYYTKTISKYSGLSKEFIPRGLKKLEDLNIIKLVLDRESGKYKGKRLIYTPEKVADTETINGKADNGKSKNDKSDTSEDSSYKEDSNKDAKAPTSFLRKETGGKIEELLVWGAKVRKKEFLDVPTQRKQLKALQMSGFTPRQIMNTFSDALHSNYWQQSDRLPDFKTVYSNLKNKKYRV